MPIYEYKCSKCGEIFEAFQKVNDNPLKECRFCKGSVTRLISQTSFQLKGSGWYLTDYARKNAPAGSSGDSEAKSKESPSKPAEKSKESGSSTS